VFHAHDFLRFPSKPSLLPSSRFVVSPVKSVVAIQQATDFSNTCRNNQTAQAKAGSAAYEIDAN
jgi:hypothetical protein